MQPPSVSEQNQDRNNFNCDAFASPCTMKDSVFIKNPFSRMASPIPMSLDRRNVDRVVAPYFSPGKIIHDFQPINPPRSLLDTPLHLQFSGSKQMDEDTEGVPVMESLPSAMPEYPSNARTNLLS